MSTTEIEGRWALILAGGDGTRLQELTRRITGSPIPKQYCCLLGKQSLLEATLARTRYFAPAERTAVVVNRNHLALAETQLCNLPSCNVLVQASNRDTGPGLLFALLALARRHPAATVAVFPSDHYVDDDRRFMGHVQRAMHIVALHPDKIVVLGIRPDRADPGFGYIVPAESLCPEALGASRVAGFSEKPNLAAARDLLSRQALWNSFVMVFHLPLMLDLLRRMVPAELAQVQHAQDEPEAYARLLPWNFSTRILARIPEHLAVVRVEDVLWSDWGTRDSIERTLTTLQRVPPWLLTEPGQSRVAEPAAA